MTDDTTQAGSPVVVGVDGSDHSLAAADLAADEAARRRLPLEIVHASMPPVVMRPPQMPPDLPPVGPVPETYDQAFEEQGEQLLGTAADRVRAAHPDLAITTRRRTGYPGGVLADASRHAALVVVGHRGLGGFAELLVGSVAVQLAHHAACPLLVVRGQAAAGAPVVVGVDGSEGSRRAAEFAAETAELYEAPLTVLYAWTGDAGWPPAQAQAGVPPPGVPEEVTGLVSDLAAKHPQVRAAPEVVRGGNAHEALVAASRNARLVVVGSRGRGGFRGLLLGSVSQALIHHAHCPVAVLKLADRGVVAPDEVGK